MNTPKRSALQSDPSPCKGCEHAETCKLFHRACVRFYVHVETGINSEELPKHHNFTYYDEVFGEEYDEHKVNIITTKELLHMYAQVKDKEDFLMQKIRQLYESSVGSEFNDVFSDTCKQWTFKWAVSEKTNILCGAIGYERPNAQSCMVNFLYIRSAFKKKGIGTRLLNSVEREGVRMLTSPEEDSIKFYEHNGYSAVGGTGHIVYQKYAT